MKKNFLAILLVLTMVLSVACSSKDEATDEPSAAPTQSVKDDSASTPAPTDKPTAEPTKEPVAVPTDEPVTENPDSIYYNENGEMYVEYTEDYYNKHTYLGIEPYNFEEYAPIAPYVGSWNISTENPTDFTGYYFYSDGYASRIYGNGAVSPVIASFNINDDSSLYVDEWGIGFKIENDRLVDSYSNEIPYADIEYPVTEYIAPDFCGYWATEDYVQKLTDEYLFIDFNGPSFTYISPEITINGHVETISPICISLIDDETGYTETLYMEYANSLVSEDNKEWFLFSSYDSEYQGPESNNTEPLSEEEQMLSESYLGGVLPYDPDEYALIQPYVGKWYNGSLGYTSIAGYYIYSDGFVSEVEYSGAVRPIVSECYIDFDGSIVLYDIPYTLVDGVLTERTGRQFFKTDNDYPSWSYSEEFCGEWRYNDEDGNPTEEGVMILPDSTYSYFENNSFKVGNIQSVSNTSIALIDDETEEPFLYLSMYSSDSLEVSYSQDDGEIGAMYYYGPAYDDKAG